MKKRPGRKEVGFPKEVYVEIEEDTDGTTYLNAHDEPQPEVNGTKLIALYKFERIVTVENTTKIT